MQTMKKMGVPLSLLYFLAPSLVFVSSVYFVIPALVKNGWSLFLSYNLFYFGLLTLLAGLVLGLYLLEGNALSWKAFAERVCIKPMRGQDWLWYAGMFLAGLVISAVFFPTRNWLAGIPFFAPPEIVPSFFDPRTVPSIVATEFLGYPLKGQYWLIPFYLVFFFSNIFGEALFNKGYAFPRQEAVFGKWTWIVNGLFTALFYSLFLRWYVFSSIGTCLILAYVFQKRKNLSILILWYFTVNLLGMTQLWTGIFA